MKLEIGKDGIKITEDPIYKDIKNVFTDEEPTWKQVEIKCPRCGGNPDMKDIDFTSSTYKCPYCGEVIQLPKSGKTSKVVNISNVYHINNTPQKESEVETDSEGYPRRPLEERKLNTKIWLGIVIAMSAFFMLIFGGAIMENARYSHKSSPAIEQNVEQDINPFADNNIVAYFDGYNGEGTYEIVISPKFEGLEYELECSAEQGKFKTGDTVKLRITNAEHFKGKYNFTVLEATATAQLEDKIEPEYMTP